MSSESEIKNTIKESRERAGLNQQEFSEMLGIPIGTIQNWEQGRRIPPEWAESLIVEKLSSMIKTNSRNLEKLPETRKSRMLEIDTYRYGELTITQQKYGAHEIKISKEGFDGNISIFTRNTDGEKIKPHMTFDSLHLYMESFGEITTLKEVLTEAEEFFHRIEDFPELA